MNENQYFEWLVRQVKDGLKYKVLLRMMHDKEFVYVLHMDENRVADVRDLRLDFVSIHKQWTIEDLEARLEIVSFLEVMIALSRRCEFQTNIPAPNWAKQFLEHLDLEYYSGRLTPDQREDVDGVLERLIYRQYAHSGKGGFFPLNRAEQDQTDVEIWYQMHAFIIEKHLV